MSNNVVSQFITNKPIFIVYILYALYNVGIIYFNLK